MFDPDGVPDFFPGTTPDVVALTGSELQRIGGEIRTTGESVTSAFEQLKGCYRAPEASTLITSMRPMRTLSGDFGADIWAMGAILQRFGEDMKGPYEQLQQMLARARVFVAKCKQSDAEGKEWQSYDNWVQEENSYHTDTANLLQQMMDIQVEAANEIEALIGGLGWWPDDFTRQKRGLNGGLAYHARAMSSGEGPPPPWGSPEEYDAPWISDVGHSLVGILDGLTTVLGIQWLAQSTGWKWDDDFFQWAFDHPPADMHQMFDAWAEMGNDTLMLLNKIPGVGKLLPDGMSEQLDQRFDDTIRTIGDDWSKGNQTSSVLGVLGLIPIGPTKLAGLTSKVGKLGKVGKLASKVPPVRVAVAGADKFLDFRSRIRSGAIEGTLKIPVVGSVLKGYSHIPILGKSVRLDPHVPLSRPPRLDLPSHATRTSPALVTTRAGALDPHIGDTNHNRWSTDPHDTTPTHTTGDPAHPTVSLPHSPHPGTTVPTHPGSIDPNRPGTTEPERPGTTVPARPGSGDPARSGPTDPVTPRPADPLDHQRPEPPATPVPPATVGTPNAAHTGTSNTPGAPSRPERAPADNAAQQPTNGSSDRASGDNQPTGRQPEPAPRRTPETQRTDRNSATEAQRKTDGQTTPDPRHRTEDPHSTEQQHSTQERHSADERRRTEEQDRRTREEEVHRTREETRRERPAEVGTAHRGDGGSNDPESGVSRNEPVPPIQPTYPIHAGAGESTISNRLEPNRTPDSTTPDRPHQDPSRARASNDRSIRDGLEPNRSTNRHTEPDSLAPHRSDADRLEGHRAEGHRAEGDRVEGDRVEGDRVEGDRVEGDGLDKARQSSAGRERVRRESPDAPERRTDDRDARNSSQTDPAPEPLDDADLARLPAPDPALRRADSPRTESRRPVPSHRTSDPETTPRTPRHGAAAAVDEHGRQRREAEDPFARSELGDRRFRASEADHRALAEQGRMHAGKLGEIRERLGRQVGNPDALSETEVTSLERMLIGHDHQDINDAFRAGDRSVEHRPVVRVAVSALNKLPDFHGEVRRGVSFDSADDFKRFLDRYRPGQTAKEPAFTHSAKPAESVKGADDADRWRGAEDFSGGQYSKGRVILHIDSRHGKDLSFMRDPFTGIDEVVHGPHTPFYPTRMPYQDKETGIWHVHARDYGGPVEPLPKDLDPFADRRSNSTSHNTPNTTVDPFDEHRTRHDVPDPDRTQRIPSEQVRRLDGDHGRRDNSPYRHPDDPTPHDDPDTTQPVKHQHTERDTADNKHHDSPEPNNQETHQHHDDPDTTQPVKRHHEQDTTADGDEHDGGVDSDTQEVQEQDELHGAEHADGDPERTQRVHVAGREVKKEPWEHLVSREQIHWHIPSERGRVPELWIKHGGNHLEPVTPEEQSMLHQLGLEPPRAHGEPGRPRGESQPDRYRRLDLDGAHETRLAQAAGHQPLRTVEQWKNLVNPHFTKGWIEFQRNCSAVTRAVVDLIQGRRTRIADGDFFKSPEGTAVPGDYDDTYEWMGVRNPGYRMDRHLPPSHPDPAAHQAAFTQNAYHSVAQGLKGRPPGTVAAVCVRWAHPGGGHWFAAYVDEHGGIRHLDVQPAPNAIHQPWPPQYGSNLERLEYTIREPDGDWEGGDSAAPESTW